MQTIQIILFHYFKRKEKQINFIMILGHGFSHHSLAQPG